MLDELVSHALRHSRRGERGQGMVEYALIVILIAIVVITVVMVIGHTTSTLYSNVSSGLTA
jgi:pilus assembly protein Flp/PilA